jgi:hypothetical protein
MVDIIKCGGQRIVEYRHGFVEGYSVLAQVTLGLLTISFEIHAGILVDDTLCIHRV